MDNKFRILAIIMIVSVIGISAIITLTIIQNNPSQQGDEEELTPPNGFHFNGVDIRWIQVCGFQIKTKETIIYVDPFELLSTANYEKADYIFVTHSHLPHFSVSDIYDLSDNETVIIAFSRALGLGLVNLPVKEMHYVTEGELLTFDGVSFETVPMYNIDKFRDSGVLFHPPGDGIGVVIDFGTARIYHAGDTDRIPEMKNIIADVALLPVSGNAWMTPSEAAGAVDDLKEAGDLKYAIPMHWDNTGFKLDATAFGELANCSTVILTTQFGWSKS